MTRGERRDIRLKGASIEKRGSRGLEVDRSSSTHVALKGSYNGSDETRGGRISTVRSGFKGRDLRHFINASQWTSSEHFMMDRTATTFLKRLTMDRSIVTVD